MTKVLIKLFVGLLLAIVSVACTDLEENLVGEITEELANEWPGNIDPTPIDVIPGLYSQLRNTGTTNHGGYYTLQEVTSDEMVICAKGGDWYDGGVSIQLHQHTYGPDHPFVFNAMVQTYAVIVEANRVLAEGVLTPREIAEARGVRAYLYWRLLDLYGRVKIITETDTDPPQATRAEVFHFVEHELLGILGIEEITASMDLSDSFLVADGRSAYVMNRYAALGILAKLYLNAEVYIDSAMYDQAALAASYVIDSGVYRLCGPGCSVRNLGRRPAVGADPEVLEGYAAVFAPNNEDNPEHIFSIYYDELTGAGMNFSQMNLHYNSQLTYNLAEQPWNGYATLEEFYNSYDEDDQRKQASFLVGPQLDFSGSALLDYMSDDDDIQLTYTPEINELYPNSLREAGARPAKFSFKQFGRTDMDNDFPIVRLGELYLIRGEAKARQTGDWTQAEADVNILRARAGVAPYNGHLTEEKFLAERGREMFQEAARRTDLIRFGRYNDAWWEKPVSEPYRNIFPIPYWTGEGWTQNPGY